MAPDVEELIKRVNTLTLDKNRLRQKLTQLMNGHSNGKDPLGRGSLAKLSSSSFEFCEMPAANSTGNTSTDKTPSLGARMNLIAGVECSTSCEDDILYMNELYRKRLDEYDENWDLVQSKCSALLSELNALQRHFVRMRRENLELEEKYKSQCDENDKIKGELQTVVLNYETQLSAMSEHLSSLTRKIDLEDDDAPTRSIRNPNYID